MFLTIPVLYSCFDLDEVPYTSLSPNNFYKDSKELEMGVRSTYRGLRDMLGDRYYGCLEVATEFGSPTNTKWEYPKTNFWIDINNPDISYGPGCWSKGFNVINCANIVLARGEGIDMNQEEKEEPHCELENDFLNDDLSLIIECNTFDPAKQMQRIRKYAGMNRKEFSEWLNIPYRTMTDWELGNRTMPVYLLELIVYKVNHEIANAKEKQDASGRKNKQEHL